MRAEKLALIIADVSAGFMVVLMGFQMLTFPFNMIWVIFNLWLWVVFPIVILWSKKKENTKPI